MKQWSIIFIFVTNMKTPLMSSKKVMLTSEYNHFDLLPIKKYHQCCTRIPETILLERGFIKDWVFNSHKINNHPILKKRKQNLSTFSVVKTFCIKNGYGQVISGCSNIRQIKEKVKQAMKQQKDYDFIKDKKVIEVTTLSNEVLMMNLVDFLEYVSQNKYSEQNFYQKWKMIQEKVSFTKIDEYYKVENVRNNHLIESKCQKIINLNTTEATVHTTQVEDDPYKNSSPNKNIVVSQTKGIEGYKFFDTFLNKKFFQMSSDLIDFIQKNLKCLVQSVITKFVINKQRQPHLISVSELSIKPAKKIADMKEFQMAKQKGFIKVQEYQRCLDIYIHQNMQKYQNLMATPINNRRKVCKGKLCKIPLQQINLPPLLQQKLKIPTLSANSRVISIELRDAVLKRKRRIIQKLAQNKIISQSYQISDESSEYESQGEQDLQIGNKIKVKQLKVCENCFVFYFHVNRFYDLDVYGNMIQKKVPLATNVHTNQSVNKSQIFKSPSQKSYNFLNKEQVKRLRSKNSSPIKEIKQEDFENLAKQFSDKKLQEEQKQQFQLQIKPVTNKEDNKQQKKIRLQKSKSKSNSKKILTPIKKQKDPSLTKTQKEIKSLKRLPSANIKSKVKLDPINNPKLTIAENSLNNNPTDTKGHRLLALSKLSQPVKIQQKAKSKTMHAGMMSLKQKKPQNHTQAIQQLLKKISSLPDSSREQLIYHAKKYFKDNLPQPIQRRSYSTYYDPHLYQFMSISPISIHPKRRIKKRPQMSLKRLSELTDYPEIVSKSQFIFDTIIVNQQTTIPFCVITTKVVNPDNLRSGQTFQNIFIINDLFDCFIEHISMVKELLQQAQVYNKRIILFNYPGQSHTIYNRGNTEAFSIYFGQVLDKLIFRLSTQKTELKIIDLNKDNFKFCGFGLGGHLLAHYLSAYSATFMGRISSVMLVNSFMQYPKRYRQILQSLLELYQSNDPTVPDQAHLYYNKAINSQQTSPQEMEHKAGLNPIRVQDRVYLLECVLKEIKQSQSTTSYTIEPQFFEEEDKYQVSIIYGKNNTVVSKQNVQQFIYYRNNPKQEIPQRVLIQIQGGHDIFADNYQDIFRVITLFARK